MYHVLVKKLSCSVSDSSASLHVMSSSCHQRFTSRKDASSVRILRILGSLTSAPEAQELFQEAAHAGHWGAAYAYALLKLEENESHLTRDLLLEPTAQKLATF